jgi:hypothetical protein
MSRNRSESATVLRRTRVAGDYAPLLAAFGNVFARRASDERAWAPPIGLSWVILLLVAFSLARRLGREHMEELSGQPAATTVAPPPP